MKYQQITVDFVNMVFTACSYLALAGAVWIFLRLIQACFWLPRHLKRQNHVQRMLQDKVFMHFLFVLLNSFSKENANITSYRERFRMKNSHIIYIYILFFYYIFNYIYIYNKLYIFLIKVFIESILHIFFFFFDQYIV